MMSYNITFQVVVGIRYDRSTYALAAAGGVAATACCCKTFNSLQVTIKTNLLAELKHQAPNYPVTCFVSRPSGITLVKFHSLQVTIKTNLLAELKHQAPN